MKNYLFALLIFIGYLSPIQSVFASEDEHEGEEGISKIDNNMAKKVGVETAYLASKTLNQTIPVYGSTTIGAEQLFQVGARYNGVIKTINFTVGDTVKKGDLLAVIESNESLNTYKITSPVSGTVLQRNGNIGGITQNTSLCGSELNSMGQVLNANFLSCLCGSEPATAKATRRKQFLSCLCGSEPTGPQGVAGQKFLSCLCGSEPQVY